MNGKALLIITLSIALLTACKGHTIDNSENVNPRDTVNVPEGSTGEDSIAYIENTILQSPISAKDLLGLSEVHSVEDMIFNYNNFELAKEDPEHASAYLATHRDSAAIRLVNRFMRMGNLVAINGKANDKLQWAMAVNAALDSFRVAVPSLPASSALDEIEGVVDRFSTQTQSEMNFQCYVYAMVEYYRTIEAYRKWLLEVPSGLRPLMQEEYEAWHDLNEARFYFWRDISYKQEWYSMKPMEIEGYYANLSENRRAELDVERGVVMDGKPYHQKGKTVTLGQWEQWIKEHSVPEDIDILKEIGDDEHIPNDDIVSERVKSLKTTFTRWLAARQAIVAALPEEQGKYYDSITADIHSRMIGKLANLICYDTE